MQKLAVACPKLEHLCVNLYEAGEDKNESDIIGRLSGASHSPTGFEQALQVTASMKKLRTLRLANPPEYCEVFHRVGYHAVHE